MIQKLGNTCVLITVIHMRKYLASVSPAADSSVAQQRSINKSAKNKKQKRSLGAAGMVICTSRPAAAAFASETATHAPVSEAEVNRKH